MSKKHFEARKGKDGLIELSLDGTTHRQVTSYTIDGPLIRFGLAGDDGATYSCKEGDEDFKGLAEVFSDASGAQEPVKKDEKKGIDPVKTA